MPFPASISRQPTAGLGFAAKMVDDCLNEAVNIRASDLHLQPRSDSWEVFYRIDGVLHLAKTFPMYWYFQWQMGQREVRIPSQLA